MSALSRVRFLFCFIVVVLLVSSCLPSLHPIYTDSTRVTDDRLLGSWGASGSGLKVDLSYDIKVSVSGDTTVTIGPKDQEEYGKEETELEKETSSKFNEALHSLGFSDDDSWTFEQASIITFEKYKNPTSNATIKINPGVPSFAPEGYKVKSQEFLPYYILTYKEQQLDEIITTYLIVNMTEIGDSYYLDFMPFPKGDKQRRGAFSANYIPGHTFAKVTFDDDKLNIEMFDGAYIEDLLKNRRIRLRHEKLGAEGEIVLTASTKELRSFIEKYGDQEDLFHDSEKLVQL